MRFIFTLFIYMLYSRFYLIVITIYRRATHQIGYEASKEHLRADNHHRKSYVEIWISRNQITMNAL